MNRTLLLIGITLLMLTGCAKEAVNPQHLLQSANQAYQDQDFATWLEYMEQLADISPNSPLISYNLACAYARNGKINPALAALEKSITMGFGSFAAQDPDLATLTASPAFTALMEMATALNTPVTSSQVAFTVAEPDLIPEGIARNPIDGSFFIGSLYKSKIIRVDRNGNKSDFTSEHQDGLRPVTGMKVDPVRRELWACSQVSSGNTRQFNPEEMGWSGVFRYDLNTGKLLKKYILFEPEQQHLFNDLIILNNGDVYITDSATGGIYLIRRDKNQLELFLRSAEFIYPNGIARNPNQDKFYMAGSIQGIVLVDLNSATYRPLTLPADVTTVGVDGLYFFKNSLVAIQNGLGRISRFYLDDSGLKVIRQEIIEAGNPHFNIPTTGTLAGNEFYYIANSQMRAFDADGKIYPPDKLNDIVVLKTNLNEF